MKKHNSFFKYILTGWVFLFLMSVFPLLCMASGTSGMQVTMRDGFVIEAAEKPSGAPLASASFPPVISENRKLKSLNIGAIEAVENGKVFQMDWAGILGTVSEIELLSPGLSPYKKGRARIKTINGVVHDLQDFSLLRYTGHDSAVVDFSIYSWDGFNRFWREENISITKVAKIVFLHPGALAAAPVQILHKSSVAVAKPEKSVRPDAFSMRFDPGSYDIQQEYYRKLKTAAAFVKGRASARMKIYISGHGDYDENKEKSMKTSKKRAESVKKYFVEKAKVPSSRIIVSYHGDKKPVATNKTPEGRSKNRRVDIEIR